MTRTSVWNPFVGYNNAQNLTVLSEPHVLILVFDGLKLQRIKTLLWDQVLSILPAFCWASRRFVLNSGFNMCGADHHSPGSVYPTVKPSGCRPTWLRSEAPSSHHKRLRFLRNDENIVIKADLIFAPAAWLFVLFSLLVPLNSITCEHFKNFKKKEVTL